MKPLSIEIEAKDLYASAGIWRGKESGDWSRRICWSRS